MGRENDYSDQYFLFSVYMAFIIKIDFIKFITDKNLY